MKAVEGASLNLAANRSRAFELIPVSRETEHRLDLFINLLLDWQKTTNLIAPSTISELWTRHVADSLQLLALSPDARIWLDLGSGGGFPGIVIGCALAEKPGVQVHLVESNAKKAAFLREAARVTGSPVIVHNERIEVFAARTPMKADVITARALASLNVLFAYIEPLLKTGAKALLLKGQHVEDELTEASKCWNINRELLASKTDSAGRIVVVHGLNRR